MNLLAQPTRTEMLATIKDMNLAGVIPDLTAEALAGATDDQLEALIDNAKIARAER